MKVKILLLMTISCVLTFQGCSAGPSSATPPVLAQTTYSASSLSGTYSIELVSPFSTNGAPFYSGSGTLQMNGSGGVSGGTVNVYFSTQTTPCVYTVTGTYTLQSTALGTAAITLATSTAGCTSAGTWHMALAAGNGGTNFQFSSTDGNVIAGSAVKQ